ncbi:EAL domain-containing protein [Brevibacterium sp. 5221]|uniref:EAL domain-containing protein n=1 Tax=Brevibacterium rongguiense TaxID=2695267 RepID=A0A6N9H4T5_9MICO|nr:MULTISPECIES: EAL domain-containing protein [Brevibacterium]MYM19030.1 EAL domain-containing protein [Brevibacterium rongguiense]WAL40681.1 EAL domain-containing protein [Brevibacterium sp. BRM-1]
MLTASSDATAPDLERLIRSGLIDCVFEPVRDVTTDAPAGYRVRHINSEDPQLGHEESTSLRAVLRQSPLVGDIDSSFRETGLRAAEAAGLESHTRLFMTAEPESLVTLEDRSGEPDRSVILQLDAGRVARHPAAVLRSVRAARQLGWGIGVTGVGQTIESTAFLPLVNPSVVTLHEDVLRYEDEDYLAELIRLLHAHVERTGAVIVAEGVSEEDDLDLVAAIGARLITGPFVGEATSEPATIDVPREDPLGEHTARNLPVSGTPYSIAQGLRRDPLVLPHAMLGAQLRSLVRRALGSGASTVAIGAFAEEADLSEEMVSGFAALEEACGFVGMLSGGFSEAPVAGVRSGGVDSSDPLRREYAIIVVGPDWSGMVTASQRVDLGSDGRLEYDVFVTSERYACVDAARSLLSRISAAR